MEDLGWKAPQYLHWGRINFVGMRLSTSETRRAIEQKEYSGWDDIRLPFLVALRKRGYQPEAFRKFALEIGLSPNDKTVSKEEFWKMIDAFNREVIEPRANRYFFIEDPVKIELVGAPRQEVTLHLHPDFPERGERTFTVNGNFYISQKDYQSLGEGYVHRLMDCFNFRCEGKKFRYMSEAYEEYKNSAERGKIIHWLPMTGNKEVEVLMENGTALQGIGEHSLSSIKEGDIIQFERRYFVRCHKKEKNIIRCWYLHK